MPMAVKDAMHSQRMHKKDELEIPYRNTRIGPLRGPGMTPDLSSINVLIDGGIPADELIAADNEYSALAHEAHRLRLENDRMRNALTIISATLEAMENP